MPENNKENDMNKNNGKNDIKIMTIMTWVFVIGVLVACIGIAVDERITVAAFGLMMIILGCFGIATIKISRKTFVLVFVPVIGFAAFSIPVYLMLSERYPAKFPPVSDDVKLRFLGVLGIIMGICMVGGSVASRIRLKKACSFETDAVCVDYVKSRSRGIEFFTPVWEYSVNGQKYTRAEGGSSLKRSPEIGHKQTIMVNPDDPAEIFRRGSMGYLLLIITGIGLVFAGGLILGLL